MKKVEIPRFWYNVLPHLNAPLAPPIDVVDENGSRIEIIKKIRPRALQLQDESDEEWIGIPDEVLEAYEQIGRPTPLVRAIQLEKYLGTPAKIFLKREDVLPTGSFKLNTSIAQAYFAKKEGIKGLVSETGAGQWGTSLAFAANQFGLDSRIFWVKVSYEQKPYRVLQAKLLGAEVVPSPSEMTSAGREILKKDPQSPGSIGTGISEAIDFALHNDSYKYVSGSNLPHVLLHQSVIGLETKEQLLALGETPDVLVACVGGGSNLGGFMSPFIEDSRKKGLRLFGAESEAAPRLTKGEYKYDHSDPLGLTPKVLSYTLGMDYVPPPVHSGGLRQHNGSPVIGSWKNEGLLEAKAFSQEDAFEAGRLFAQYERAIPAPETNHAIKAVIDLALDCKKQQRKCNIVMCFSGSGLLDLSGYQKVLKNL
ncbi:MAG: TrpB-like pyridoxal phosphate-dependent enzyme [Ferruginibacter sp.]